MPLVSIIVPCYNEQATIRLLLDAIVGQTVPNRDIEVIIADGRSTDQTREIVTAFQCDHPDLLVRLIDNPQRNISAGLNCALSAADGRYIIRLDAHSVPTPAYVATCIEDLEAGRGENVGGVWQIRPGGAGLMPSAISLAAAHPLGVGDALYRYATEPGYVDTVPFGAFRRELFERFGQFDETLLSNEDYEFNARLRPGGGRVWLDPRIRSAYFARSSLSALGKQYWRYGYWKLRMLRRYPKTLRFRQAAPPVFVISLIVLLLSSLWFSLAWRLLAAELIVYFLALAVGSLKPARRAGSAGLLLAIPLAIATMHLSWGAGFLWSFFGSFIKRVK